MSPVEIKDSRRLTGPNILWDHAGAVLEAYGPEAEVEALVSAWRRHVRAMLDAVGWPSEEPAYRHFPGGASLAISAPIDVLYSATEVNEWAVETASAEISGRETPDLEEGVSRLRREIEGERSSALLALRDAAREHDVVFFSDDHRATIGLGKGSLTFGVKELPDPGSIDWTRVSDIPVAMITGTNGKSTTVRLVGAMVRAEGLIEGYSSTDGIVVDGVTVERGDYSGPEGARAVLRNKRVEAAVLETARGGMLRRGLPIPRADAALVTNVAEDHLGEFGIHDLPSLIETKLVVRRAVGQKGVLVLNADDPGLRARGADLGVPVAWFSLDIDRSGLRRDILEGSEAAWLEGEKLVRMRNWHREEVIPVGEIPVTLNGAARHNIANALSAILVGGRLGLSLEAMAVGLRRFAASPEENPGRGNLFELNGVTALVDFAHNAHGFRSLFEMAAALPVKRRLIILGQAGDRSNASILEQVSITWKAGFDRIIIKEMEVYLRGRRKGEIPGLIEAELRRLGVGDAVIGHADCEIEAVRQALGWARPGDLLLLLVYAERKETFELLRELQKAGWRPGKPLPVETRVVTF